AALDDKPLLHHKNLIGAADGGEAVRDDKGGAPAHQLCKAALDHGLRLGIERAGGLVENEDARLCQESARDGQALPLAARELDATLANNGVVSLGKALGKLVDARGTAGKEELLITGIGAREHDVFADGAVEEKRLLQHYAQLRAEGVQVYGYQIHTINQHPARGWRVEGAKQADDGG